MKYFKPAKVFALSFVTAALLMSSTGAAEAPGSVNDPVVTKSYVDKAVADAIANLNLSATNNSNDIPVTVNTSDGLSAEDIALQMDFAIKQTAFFKVVDKIPVGSKLIATEDGTEIILRAGKGLVISNAVNGISDLTLGKDLTNGLALTKDHYIVIPRSGRGVSVTEQATFMVKGGYKLVAPGESY